MINNKYYPATEIPHGGGPVLLAARHDEKKQLNWHLAVHSRGGWYSYNLHDYCDNKGWIPLVWCELDDMVMVLEAFEKESV